MRGVGVVNLTTTIGTFQLWVTFLRGRHSRNIHINTVLTALKTEGLGILDVPCNGGL